MKDQRLKEKSRDARLDGNAAAGALHEIFGLEMTASSVECASCGREAPLGALPAFVHAPGIVLRCASCEAVILRIVRTPESIVLDARGAVALRLARPELLPRAVPENDSLGG
jgi:hypothetical protein